MAPKDMQLILTRLASIEAQLMNLTKMVQCLVNSGTGSSVGSHELPDGVVLQLDSVEHLRLLEETVQDKQTKKAMIGYLSMMGGSTVGDGTRRVLREVFTNELALKLNFAGRGAKIGIGNMAVTEVITGAVLKNKHLSTSILEIQNEIKVWLRQACDRRAGSRRDRGSSGQTRWVSATATIARPTDQIHLA